VEREDLLLSAQRFPGFLPTRNEILPTTSAVPGRNGRTYSKYGLGASLAAAPLYLLGRSRLAVSMLNPLVLAACGWLLARFAQDLGYRPRTGRFLALAGLFSTFAWPYTKTFYPQPGAALLILAALYLAFRWRREGRPGALWALGLCCAGVILFRVSEAIILPALGLYLVFGVPAGRRWRWLIPVGAGVAGALALTALYNWLRFGAFFSTGYHEVEWSNPILLGLYGLLISPGKGVLFYAPLLVLSLGSWRLFARRHPAETWLIAGLWLSFLVFYAPYKYWTGGWNWGPRFLLPVVLPGLLPLGALLDGWGKARALGQRPQAAWVLGAVFFALGLFLQFPAIVVDHSRPLVQAVFESGDPDAYTRTIIDPAHAPLFRQWPAALELLAAYRRPEIWQAARLSLGEIRSFPAATPDLIPLLEAEFTRRNTLDFWWLHPRLSDPGYPVWLAVLPWLGLGLAGLWTMVRKGNLDEETRK
jgi:hypothetical protein